MGITDNILNWIKLSPKYILPIALLSALLLLLPDPWLAKFGLDAFVKTYRMWIGLVMLSSAALLLSHFGFWARDKLVDLFRTRRLLRAGRDCLRNLTPDEKRTLADFILFKSRTQDLDIRSGVTKALEHANIIYRSADVGTLLGGFAYNLQPWAWEELNAHPELLEPELSGRRTELEQKRRRRC